MNRVIVLLGSNLGSSQLLFQQATQLLHDKLGKIRSQSALYQSLPWGFEHANDFLNQVLILETTFSAHEVLSICLQTEFDLGRERTEAGGYAARTIDIDLLFMNEEEVETESLVLPHPRLHLRKFTLLPLVELMPDFIHPKLKKSMQALLMECIDSSEVKKL